MDRYLLRNQGFSLVELAVVMGVIAILTGAVTPLIIRSIELKAAEKAVTEVGLIQTAARKFYSAHKSWPNNLNQMQEEGYVGPLWNLRNPWGNGYVLNSAPKTFTVTTLVPPHLSDVLVSRLPQSSKLDSNVTSTIGLSSGDLITPGIIAAWSGAIADIPSGWQLCDGTNGTPDLRDKFIIGAGQDDGASAKTSVTGVLTQSGGTISHNHAGSTGIHVLTVSQVPSLSVTLPMFSPNQASPAAPTIQRGQNPADGSLTLTTSGGGGGHAHSIGADTHLPPFYALAFIMKLP